MELYFYWLNFAYVALAKEYLRESNIERVLEYTEKACENGIANYYWMCKTDEMFTDEKKNNEKESLKWALISCWDECADKTGNPIVTSERYKKCVEKIEALK